MSAILKRRIERIEEAILPRPGPKIIILVELTAEDSADDRASFNQSIDSAIGNGQRVVIVDGRTNRDERAGVEYVDSEFEAQLIVLASQPSEAGRENALADVMGELTGQVIGVSDSKKTRLG